jgi:hypothetical protein
MITRLLTLFAVGFAAGSCVFAQPAASQKMIDMSVQVFGVIQENGKPKPVALFEGFLADSKHVVTSTGCCDKTKEGAEKTPFVRLGDDFVPGQMVWSGADNIAILQIEKEAKSPGLILMPAKMTQTGQSAYTVQIPQKGDATVGEGKIQDVLKNDKVPYPYFKLTPTTDSVAMGGGLFDACGNVIGISLLTDKGSQYAFIIDPLGEGLQKLGIQAAAADKPCGGTTQQSGNNKGDNGGDKGTKEARKGDDKGGDKGGDKGEEPELPFRMPKGPEWIGVGIVVGLVALALRRRGNRPAVARVGADPMPMVEPMPEPRPYLVPAPAPAPVPIRPLKPALRGISGQYAGVSIPLETVPSTLGRDPRGVNLVFPQDADSVSKHHCTVRWDAARGVFVLLDLGSTNGTFLGSGERLTPGEPRDLRPGDRFYIGDLRNQFEVNMVDPSTLDGSNAQ